MQIAVQSAKRDRLSRTKAAGDSYDSLQQLLYFSSHFFNSIFRSILVSLSYVLTYFFPHCIKIQAGFTSLIIACIGSHMLKSGEIWYHVGYSTEGSSDHDTGIRRYPGFIRMEYLLELKMTKVAPEFSRFALHSTLGLAQPQLFPLSQ